MRQEPIFSAVVGNSWALGFFDVYPDLRSVWEQGKTKIEGTVAVNTGTLKMYLEMAQEEGKKHIRGAYIQEYYWNPRALEQCAKQIMREIETHYPRTTSQKQLDQEKLQV